MSSTLYRSLRVDYIHYHTTVINLIKRIPNREISIFSKITECPLVPGHSMQSVRFQKYYFTRVKLVTINIMYVHGF